MPDQLPDPLTPEGCVLQDFPHTPIYRARLFGSSFHARATDAEWRAGVTLWLKSWDQVPAGSLPDDDIELCRLAELARDMKTWKKVKTGALRGWVKSSDGRLYHPVVAEGINNALEAKAAQRDKTLKARIAALEKRLKEASDESQKEAITEEIRRLKLSLSQKALASVTDPDTDPVTGSKRREGKGREGNNYSEPTGSGADGAKPRLTDPDEIIFGYGLQMLLAAGNAEKNARSFLGGLRKAHGDAALIDKLRECAKARPLQPLEWLAAALPPPAVAGSKPNAQEALEASNRAIAAQFLEERGAHAAH
jgi:hypothetical protein